MQVMRMLFTILLLVGLCGTRLPAQNGKYRFSRLDITHGLSHNAIPAFLRLRPSPHTNG
jgi:hypothetical protein